MKSIAATVLMTLAASSVSAATYTFDLQVPAVGGDAGTLSGNTLIIQQGDLTGNFQGRFLTDAAYTSTTLTAGSSFDANSVTRFYNGLGVCNDGPCYGSDPLHTVDGHSGDGSITDFVEMSFEAGGNAVEVTLSGLLLGWVGDFSEGGADGYSGTNGTYEVLLDVAGLSGIDIGDFLGASGTAVVDPSLPGYGTSIVEFLGLDLFDDIFGIKAGIEGSWKLRSVVVDYSVPEVPLPAAAWLLLGGIGGLAALRRSKKRA